MVFNSFSFLVFYPLVVLVYFIIPKKARYLWLLAASYYFYMSWNPKYALLLAASTLITYLGGIGLQCAKDKAGTVKKWIVAGAFAANLGILFFFKYYDFALELLGRALAGFGVSLQIRHFDVLLPVGISFYTFQALSYIMDVYRGKIEAEKNPFRYALFVSFFPQLVAGPIERSTSLLPQLRKLDEIRLWNPDRIRDGLVMMLWGYFMKLVIADRLALFVDPVFDGYAGSSGTALLVGAVLFAFQIYCDFASYSIIAVGSARIMGVVLMENFNAPYLAISIKDFWRRWHISLSTWFRDYLYIPLGGSRKGKLRTYCNLMLTFLVSGLWHGAGMHYVLWGGLHGLYQVLENVWKSARDKLWGHAGKSGSRKTGLPGMLCKGLLTFAAVDFAWIFFRADSLSAGVQICLQIARDFSFAALWDGSLFALGPGRLEMGIAVAALVVLLAADLIRYCRDQQLHEWIGHRCLFVRWTIYLLLFAAIYVFGIYGPAYDASQFIYFQF